ncbi:MAG: gliding motility-associated C-terminal domain-containing protein, partial [Lutibacter sp.]|nr:gliding motility-associated C-terminal domain-containing protein [Lutibacter sp.]
SVNLEFLNYFVYAGEDDDTYVDGYVKTTNNGEFTFPIGDKDELRPMILPNQSENTTYKGAYFKENPNNPTVFTQSFDTSSRQSALDKINELEFWDLIGDMETEVILTWNANSEISALTSDIKNLRVTGWDKGTNKWVDLGGNNLTGDLNEGSVQSIKFVPDYYEIITIGSDFALVGGIETTSYNYVITPNGDGINDYLEIEGIELRPNNTMKILNRWGALVFSKKGYNNTWNGTSEYKAIINKSASLPIGTYYYILNFYDENITHTGYIYLGR